MDSSTGAHAHRTREYLARSCDQFDTGTLGYARSSSREPTPRCVAWRALSLENSVGCVVLGATRPEPHGCPGAAKSIVEPDLRRKSELLARPGHVEPILIGKERQCAPRD